MDAKKQIIKKIDELDDNFDKLISNNSLNMTSIETLAINSFDEYKKIINSHIEELIIKKVDEKELITKKNKNGKQEDLN